MNNNDKLDQLLDEVHNMSFDDFCKSEGLPDLSEVSFDDLDKILNDIKSKQNERKFVRIEKTTLPGGKTKTKVYRSEK